MTQETSKLDRELLDEMAELGLTDLHDLIEMYMEQATETTQQLCTAIEERKAEDVNQLAHRLAGSSAVCGATSVMNSLRTLELRGREANWPAIEKDFAQAIWEIESCEQLLEEYLAGKNQPLHVAFKPPQRTPVLHS
jgi:HPt (histidine-containing phosphotransfer) domain-containing protein